MISWTRKPLAAVVAGLLIVNFAAPARAESAAEAANAVIAELGKGNPKAVWEAMPASYQKDVAELIHLAAGKIDPAVMAKANGLMGKLTTLLNTKKDFILGSSLMAQAEPAQKAELAKNWDGMVGLAKTLVDSGVMNVETLKTMEPGAFLGTTGSKLMTQMQALSKASGEDMFAQITAAKATDKEAAANGNAVVTMSHPDQPDQDVEFTQVEGKWVPAEMAAEWDAQIAEAKAGIAAIDPQAQQQQSMQAIMMMTMVETVVDQLTLAQTQEQFDATLMGLLGGFGLAPQPGGAEEPPAGTF